MNPNSLIGRFYTWLFGDPNSENNVDPNRLVLFPRRLPEAQDILFFKEYIKALGMPIIWLTVTIYVVVLTVICYFASNFIYIGVWIVSIVAAGLFTIAQIMFFWNLAGRWGYRLQLTMLNIGLGSLVWSLSIGIFFSWQTMEVQYIGMMTTIIGAILGAAAVIFSYSRVSYLVFMSSFIVPGIYFMLSKSGAYYLFSAMLYAAGFFSFLAINLMEYAKQRQLFDARQKLAMFNTELAKKDAELDQELLFASHMQMGIFPEPKTVIAPYSFQTTVLPLGRISGDYCDIITRGDIIFALVADASGHGVPAAMLTMAAKNVFSNVLNESISPSEALSRGNHEILKMIKTQDFMTGFLMKLYPSGLVEFTNAAHPTAFYQSRQGEIKFLDTSGFILGGLDDVDALYETQSVQLQKGDRLFMYTDGVIESNNPAFDFYGMERLETMLRVTRGIELGRVIPRIFSDMVSFCEGAPFRDDIAMMVIEYNP